MFWKKKDPNKFNSRRFKRVVKRAVNFLEKSPYYSFDDIENVDGNGVYALFYNGCGLDCPFYTELDHIDESIFKTAPVYIGKAAPTGWRTRRTDDGSKSSNLEKRIKEHLKSIESVTNLNPGFFSCQYIVLDPGLISSVEAEAIRRYKPLWNSVIEGFGNHNVGRNRLNQIRSDWDTLHPGRSWALQMQGPNTAQVEAEIKQSLKNKLTCQFGSL